MGARSTKRKFVDASVASLPSLLGKVPYFLLLEVWPNASSLELTACRFDVRYSVFCVLDFL